MNKLLFGATLFLVVGGMAVASTPELIVTSDTLWGTNGGGTSGAAAVITTGSYSNADFDGWDITITTISHSPSAAGGIDEGTLSAECVTTSCVTLDVFESDTNFVLPAGFTTASFTSGYSATDQGTAASTNQHAWIDPGNTYFAETDPLPVVGPFNGAGVFSASESALIASGNGPFSMTIEDIFAACTSASCAQYSTDGSLIGSVPEPASAALFGTVLALCASRLRRRRAA